MEPTTRPPNLIIGTAGHVDHGKTALIEALTGINADRLQEEQERGLTIDLGFAWFELPGGAWAGIVDVPGHERFVKNMLAGATGIDLFLLVVAADEGVMPQTREHLTILTVLDVQAGMVVITKADMVEADLLELVQEDVSEALEGTAFAGTPMVVTSAKTGQGMDELVARLDEVAAQVKPRDIAGPARLQVDRVFSVRGLGTVVTGSLIRGRLRLEQPLEVAPHGLQARVRGLEVYGRHLDVVAAPCRVGVNLAGAGREDLERGDQLIAPGSMAAAWMLDVRLRLAPDAARPLEYRERVRIHHGAAEILGRVVLLEGEELLPGQECLAQLRLEGPAVAAAGDHFVIRRYSPARAVGGGVVLDPRPARHRRREAAALDRLRALDAGGLEDRARDWTRARGLKPFSAHDLAEGLQLDPDQAEELVAQLAGDGVLSEPAPGRYLDAAAGEQLRQRVLETLAAYHLENPLRPAMPLSRLRAALENAPQELLFWALEALKGRGDATPQDNGWRLADHVPSLGEAQEQAVAQLERTCAEAGLAPPTREQALETLRQAGDPHALLDMALERGNLASAGEFIMSRAALDEAARAIEALHGEKGPFAVADARDAWGTSRKYVVPLLEFFDGTGFTRREGNVRRVARPPGPREGA